MKARSKKPGAPPARNPRVSLARSLSKSGYCSRAKAASLIQEGRVRLNGRVTRDPETRVDLSIDSLEVDGRPLAAEARIYLMLNKPRGLIVTASDEKGRETIYHLLRVGDLPWLAPVGRLDKASEGLLLFTNDNRWAAAILAPETHIEKAYHVQIDRVADEELLRRLREGASLEDGVFLAAKRVSLLRRGEKNCWLEIVLDEGKNRHIRRLLMAFGIEVLRLVRVAIGPLKLGGLSKGAFRHLRPEEVRALVPQTG